MNRLIVFGAAGMLGQEVVRAAELRRIDVVCITRRDADITNLAAVATVMETLAPTDDDVIINCAGAVPGKYDGRGVEMVAVNALGPHVLAALRPSTTPLILVSTDCVFGDRANNANVAADFPAPEDTYGRSKLAGEVDGAFISVVRTSFVGPQHGLWAWVADQPPGATLLGWANALWSGSTARAVAHALVEYSLECRDEAIEHLATAFPISKHDLVCLLADFTGRHDLVIEKVPDPIIDRRLRPTLPLESVEDSLADWI